jgi:hypothetical protein
MPLLNSRGDVLSGGGGSQGYLNGHPLPFGTSGGGAWLTDDVVLVAVPTGPQTNELVTWTPGQTTNTPLGQGANGFAAGGGRFVAWLAGVGLWGAVTDPQAGFAGPLSVAPDGTIAYIPNAQIGYGLRIVDPNGATHDVPGVIAYSEQTIGAGQAIWQGGAYGTPVPRPAAPDAGGILAIDVDGERWLYYWSPTCGLVVQLDGASDGYVLGHGETFFNRDARNVNGQLVVTWAWTAGEGPDVPVVVIDRSAPRVPIVQGPKPPDPPDPPIPPVPPDPPIPPKPPVITVENFMQLSKFDQSKVYPYQELKKSSRDGCVNVILPDGEVLSGKGETRPAGTDGPWEQGQVIGNEVTYAVDGEFYTHLIVPIDKLPR